MPTPESRFHMAAPAPEPSEPKKGEKAGFDVPGEFAEGHARLMEHFSAFWKKHDAWERGEGERPTVAECRKVSEVSRAILGMRKGTPPPQELLGSPELAETARELAKMLEKQLAGRFAEFEIPEAKRPKIETPTLPEGLTPEHFKAVKEVLGGGMEERVLPSLESLNGMDEAYMGVMYPETQREEDTARGLTSFRPPWWGKQAEASVSKSRRSWGAVYTASMQKELKTLEGALVLLDTATKPKYIDGSQHYGTVEGTDAEKDPLEALFKEVADDIRDSETELSAATGQEDKFSDNRFNWSYDNLQLVLARAKEKIMEKFTAAGLTGIDVEVIPVPATLDNLEMTLRDPASSTTDTYEWTSTPLLDDKNDDTGRRLHVGRSGRGGASRVGRDLRSSWHGRLGVRFAVMFKPATDS